MSALLNLALTSEDDVFVARQRAREVAAVLGLEAADQVRVATAVSEVGRDVLAAGGGRVTFTCAEQLRVEATAARPLTGAGAAAAARLVDSATTATDGRGRGVVVLVKALPAASRPSPEQVRAGLRAVAPTTPLEELRAQNRELTDALAEIGAKQVALEQLNAELEETNRGVVALYAELDERGEQLREADAAKSRFLANVSHELRTPVNSVLGLARLLLDPSAEALSDEQRHQVGLVRASAQDLLGLVNELLDLAKAESGRIEPVLVPVDLGELWVELEGTLRPLVAPGVDLVLQPPGAGVPATLTTDGTLLRHVLRNLLTNAIKFTERGRVHLRADARDGRLVLEVADTGIGIAPGEQGRVFEEFYQVRGPLQARSRGTGLGLPYTRRLVGILGGALALDSEPGRGSTFTVTLPLGGPQHPGAGTGTGALADRAAAAPAAAPAAAARVGLALVVDDDPAFRRVLVAHLAGLADRVLEAGDGVGALVLLREHAPDVVFLDVRMPHLDGAAVLAAMRAQNTLAGVAVVVVTAGEAPAVARAGLAGAVAALSKDDLTREALEAVLRRVAAR